MRIDEFKDMFDEKLKEKLEKCAHKSDSVLLNAMKYSLLPGGKRIRPMITYSAGIELDVEKDILIDLGIAVEMMHTASLIHDDLPAIDNDDYRRGKPSCHKVFGEGIALIAGDTLMLLSIKVLNDLKIEQSTKLKLERIFLESVSINGMMSGEAEDITMTGKKSIIDLEKILSMYEKKTGALFGFCFSAPIVFIKDEKLEREMENIGKLFGVSFQIFDDLKDLTGSFEEIGKTPRKDELMNKPTVPRIIGIEKARKLANEFYDESMERLKKIGKFKSLVNFLKSIKKEVEKY